MTLRERGCCSRISRSFLPSFSEAGCSDRARDALMITVSEGPTWMASTAGEEQVSVTDAVHNSLLARGPMLNDVRLLQLHQHSPRCVTALGARRAEDRVQSGEAASLGTCLPINRHIRGAFQRGCWTPRLHITTSIHATRIGSTRRYGGHKGDQGSDMVHQARHPE